MTDTTPLAVTGAGLIAGGALIGLLFRWLLAADRREISGLRHAPQATAQVVGVVEREGQEDPIYGGGGSGFAPVVTFRTAAGEPVRASGQYVFTSSPRRVHYNPMIPARSISRAGTMQPARGCSGGSGRFGGEDEDSGDLLVRVERDPGLHVAGLVAQRDVGDCVVADALDEWLALERARPGTYALADLAQSLI